MRLRKLQTLILTFLFTVLPTALFAQDIKYDSEPAENWLAEYTDFSVPLLFHRFDRYSKEDIARFRKTFDALKDLETADEWEGIYFDDLDPLSYSQFRWKADTGFLSFTVYSCQPELRYIDYGKVAVSADSVQSLPETVSDSPRKASPVKYIKVKWDDRRYLVEESSLPAFAEKAAGIYADSGDPLSEGFMKWTDYWVKGDLTKELTGLPEFPEKYKKFARKPITGKVISATQAKIVDEFEIDENHFVFDSAIYFLTIDVGKNQGVKKGLTFLIDEIGETIQITQVDQNNSVGVLVRHLGEGKTEICWNDNADEISCPQISRGLRVSTPTGQFYY